MKRKKKVVVEHINVCGPKCPSFQKVEGSRYGFWCMTGRILDCNFSPAKMKKGKVSNENRIVR